MTPRRSTLWILIGLLLTSTGWAATRPVDNSGVCSDSTCAPCCTIQEAVKKSSGGDVISVADGTYPETVDFRDMLSIGDITLKAASTPGSVFITSNGIDEAIMHQDQSPTLHMNTVTIEGVTLSSTSSQACLWIGHAGETVLRDVTANNCDYTALLFKDGSGDGVIGDVTMERVTANNAAVKEGIRIAGGSTVTSVTLTDCTTNSNPGHGVSVADVAGAVQIINLTAMNNGTEGVRAERSGSLTITGGTLSNNGEEGIEAFDLAVGGAVQITNLTAENNGVEGIDLVVTGPLTITGATLTDNGRAGIHAVSTSTIEISSSVISGSKNGYEGVSLEGKDAVNTTDSVTLTSVQSNDNDGNGVYLANIAGPVTVTDCIFENNGSEGLGIFDSDLDDLVITGGHATGNGDSGYNVDVDGDAAIDGARADTNGQGGFRFRFSGTVSLANCVANGNETGAGIRVFESSSNLDEVTITNCTANNNGTVESANGFNIRNVDGPVTIEGTTTNGNSWTNIRVDSTAGEVLISNVVANSSPDEEGIKIDADVGPVTIENSTVDDNALEGIVIRRENLDLETVTLRENSVTNNSNTGISLSNLSATGTFDAICNDIAGNGDGIYHDTAATVDARYVWWGDPSGPSSQGPGTGDSVFAEPGGTILFDPWLEESCTGCNGVINLTLANDSVVDTESHKSCYSITVGPSYGVYGPSGDLTLSAREVMFKDGFAVGVDGALTVRHQ